MNGTEEQLSIAIEEATELAVRELFSSGEHFYYCSLITTGEVLAPILCAWSDEALDKFLIENDVVEDREYYEWSYADSPYLDFGAKYFTRVKEMFRQRLSMQVNMTKEEWNIEFNSRLDAMERALKRLNDKGVFGIGESRNKIMINVEVVPPDYENTYRAIRLNPIEAINEWLKNMAEPLPLKVDKGDE